MFCRRGGFDRRAVVSPRRSGLRHSGCCGSQMHSLSGMRGWQTRPYETMKPHNATQRKNIIGMARAVRASRPARAALRHADARAAPPPCSSTPPLPIAHLWGRRWVQGRLRMTGPKSKFFRRARTNARRPMEIERTDNERTL